MNENNQNVNQFTRPVSYKKNYWLGFAFGILLVFLTFGTLLGAAWGAGSGHISSWGDVLFLVFPFFLLFAFIQIKLHSGRYNRVGYFVMGLLTPSTLLLVVTIIFRL